MDFVVDTNSKTVISRPVAEHAVEAAMLILPLLRLKPDLYKATVDDWEDTYRVSFIDKTVRQGYILGNPGHVPGIQVKINPFTFKIIRYGLIR